MKKELHSWLNNEASAETYEDLKADAEMASYLKIAEVASEFEVPEWNAQDHYEQIQAQLAQESSTPRVRLKWIIGIAAMIAVIATSYVYLTTLDTEITTQIAEKETIMLPDESVVTLNAASSVRYNEQQWKNERSLRLDGEAYFDVETGATFTVNTNQGTVTVVGTEFNVFARPSHFSVSCYEGLVRVSYADTLVDVPAGNELRVISDTVSMHSLAIASRPSWMADESSFDSAPLSHVFAELERHYPIQIENTSFQSKRFTGSFPHHDLEVALRSVCEPLGLEFTIEGDHVRIYAAAEE